ncbi:UNVERIFIED_CONTAM: hypothetical protein HDU68_007020 [Siphonaria sp. JEL0065]|nr:hypothetical protein HDU68_007020 [Siphonaria sp. JEL0065]
MQNITAASTLQNLPTSSTSSSSFLQPGAHATNYQQLQSGDNTQLFQDLFGHSPSPSNPLEEPPSLDSKLERDRRVHREAEKQRRESLRTGFEKLKDLLPASTIATDKNWSQTRLLESALDYISELKKISDAKARENVKLKEALRKVVAVQQEKDVEGERASSSAEGSDADDSGSAGPSTGQSSIR